MTAEEWQRVRQLCTSIQNEKEHSKLTDLMQELLKLLESNEGGRSTEGENQQPATLNTPPR
jgi:hypothetical protein